MARTEPHTYSTQAASPIHETEDILKGMFGRGGEARIRLRGQDALYRLPVEFLERSTAQPSASLCPMAHARRSHSPGTRTSRFCGLRGKGGRDSAAVRPATRWWRSRSNRTSSRRKGDDIHSNSRSACPKQCSEQSSMFPRPPDRAHDRCPRREHRHRSTAERRRARRAATNPGDQYVTLKILLPQQLDPELEEFARRGSGAGSKIPPALGV